MSKSTNHTVGDLVTLQRGFDITKLEQINGAIPVVSSGGISSYHNTAKVEGPGVVIGRKGSLGTAFYIETDFWPHDTTLWVKDFKGNEPKYAFYYLKALNLERLNSGSSNPTLNRNYVHFLKARIPASSEQKKITTVLSLLDEKIELNNRINAELEGLAKLLYDYWFVQFDFPMTAEQAAAHGDPTLTGKPYKSSGGKMTHNKTLNRKIPEGWNGTTVGKVFKTQLGGTPSRKNPDYWNPGEIAWLASGDKGQTFVMSGDEKISKSGLSNSAAALLPKGTVILSIVRHLRASILGIDAATNQSVAGIHETDRFKSCFIYPFLLGEIPRLMSVRTGAQQPHINKGEIEKSPFVIPDDETLGKYHEQTSPIFEQIENNQKQNQELAALRDWLLPMLMNGQVTVDSPQD